MERRFKSLKENDGNIEYLALKNISFISENEIDISTQIKNGGS